MQRDLRIGGFLSAALLTTLALSFLLLRSVEFAVVLYVFGVVGLLVILEPFVGLCFALAVLYIKPNDFIPALVGVRVMLLIGAATFASMLVRRILSQGSDRFASAPQNWILVWFFVAIAASHLSHLDVPRAVDGVLDFVPLAVLYLLILNLADSDARVRQMLWVLLGLTGLLAIQAVLQNFIGGGVLTYQEFRNERVWGIGRFKNPNMLAIALVSLAPLVYVRFDQVRSVLARGGLVALLGVMLYALYLTNSRSGVLALGLVTALFFSRRFGPLRGFGLTALALAAIWFLGPSRMSQLSPYESSAYGRLVAWDAGLGMLASNPLFGIGADAWIAKYQRLVAHNSFVHCAAELGLFGLFPWVLMTVVSMRNLNFVARHAVAPEHARLRASAEAVLLGYIGFAFASLFISKTYHELLFILIGLSAAITSTYTKREGRRFRLFERADLLWTLAIVVGGIVGFKLLVVIVGA